MASSSPSKFHDNESFERRPLILRGVPLLALSFQTLGIVYADLGTSPVYTLNGIWPPDQPAPSEEDVIGGVSAIIWAIIILPLFKYVVFSLSFGTDEGEGGTFALFHALYPPRRLEHSQGRVLTGDFVSLSAPNQTSLLDRLRWPIMIWALFGTSLTMADGIFTPAVSVTSAVSGLALVQPSLVYSITPISIGFLVLLFVVQQFGTSKLGYTFAPVMLTWFLLLAVTGIYNVVQAPIILRAFDPSRAVLLFVRTGRYDLLSGVLLAITGCEAMFASVGHFNALSIQLAFGVIVFPSVVLAYLGQGARIIKEGNAVMSNIFYATIPGQTGGPLYWIMCAFAIMATWIASQTLITAVFSLVQQIMVTKSLPALRMNYTSETVQGQIYIPVVNWILFIATIAIVAGFSSPAALTNAFGFSVATVMFVTSTMIGISIPLVKLRHWTLGLAFFLFFGFMDGLFWGASLTKVPIGAWVPLMLGVILTIFMIFWTWAKGLEDEFDGANHHNLREIVVHENDMVTPGRPLISQNTQHLRPITPANEKDTLAPMDEKNNGAEEADADQVELDLFPAPTNPQHNTIRAFRREEKNDELFLLSELGDKRIALPRLSTCAIFHKTASGQGVPHSFVGFLRQWPALPRVVIFLSVRVAPVPHIAKEDQYYVTAVRSIRGFYGVTYHLGFRDEFKVNIDAVIERIVSLEIRTDPRESRLTINEIRDAGLTSIHMIPHYHIMSNPERVELGSLSRPVRWIRTFLLESVYRSLMIMFPETANWLESADSIIRVGITAFI